MKSVRIVGLLLLGAIIIWLGVNSRTRINQRAIAAPSSGTTTITDLQAAAVEREVFYDRLLDAQLRAIIAEQGLTGDPSLGRDLPSIDDPLAQLGKKFFFTKALSGDKDVACATCHVPTLGGGDGLSLSIGVGADDPELLGPGRTHPSGAPTVPRNAPTTFNIAMWDQVLFFDGRVESLGKTPTKEGADGLGIRTPDAPFGTADPGAGANLTVAQARFPVTSREEMLGHSMFLEGTNQIVRGFLGERLGNYGEGVDDLTPNWWQAECEEAIPSDSDDVLMITYELIADAMAAYERSQVFVDTPWRAYIQGDATALSPAAKRGALLFYQSREQGGAACAECHAGDFFTDEQFYTLAVPQVGPGKGNGPNGDDDFGRFRETQDPNDLYAFRTSTLLNVEVTGPWGHSGAYTTLTGIIRHHVNPASAVASYDTTQLAADVQVGSMVANTNLALDQWRGLLDAGYPTVEPINLSEAQVNDLEAFMLALTDPCVKDPACLAPWMPAQDERDPDGLRLLLHMQEPSVN